MRWFDPILGLIGCMKTMKRPSGAISRIVLLIGGIAALAVLVLVLLRPPFLTAQKEKERLILPAHLDIPLHANLYKPSLRDSLDTYLTEAPVSFTIPATKKGASPVIEITAASGADTSGLQSDLIPVDQGTKVTITNSQRTHQAGRFHLLAKDPEDSTILLQQDFGWGQLLFNQDQTTYKPNTTAEFSLGFLDDQGHVVCGAGMFVMVTDPNGIKTFFGTADGSIKVNPGCYTDTPTTDPDYRVQYGTSIPGEYQVQMVAQADTGERTLKTSFTVQDQDITVVQHAPTRFTPKGSLESSIKVGVQNAGRYSVSTLIPGDFGVSKTDATVGASEGQKTLNWTIDAKAGQEIELRYTLDPPDTTPRISTLGPVSVTAQSPPSSTPTVVVSATPTVISSATITPSTPAPSATVTATQTIPPPVVHTTRWSVAVDQQPKTPAVQKSSQEIAAQPNPEHPTSQAVIKGAIEDVKRDEAITQSLPKTKTGRKPVIEITKEHTSHQTLLGTDVVPEGDHTKLTITPPQNAMEPGTYTVKAKDPDTGAVIFEQQYAWGVLAFNPDYAVYPPYAQANLAMGVLDDRGKMVCDAALTLKITDPTGAVSVLSTGNGTIVVSDECSVYLTDKPDYSAQYFTSGVGEYLVELTAITQNGKRTLHDHFFVSDNDAVYVQRSAPTRIYPPKTYVSKLRLTAKKGGTYQVTERVPAGFEITNTDASIQKGTDDTLLHWTVSIAASKTKELTYQFKAPNISPYLYLLGPAQLGGSVTWTEPRTWQIASDNACTSNGTGGGNWSATGSWASCGGVAPTSADTVTILANDTITLDTAPTIQTININNSGVLTNNGTAQTLTLSTTTAGSTMFTLGASGTFTPATSITVTISANANVTTTSGTITFFDLNLTPTTTIGTKTYTMGSGALTVNGNFTIRPTSSGLGTSLVVNMGAAITVAAGKTTTITRTGSGNPTSKLDTTASNYAFSTGLLNIATGATFTSNSSLVTLSGTSGTLLTKAGTLTAVGTTSEWDVTSASGTPTLLSAAVTFHILKINAAVGAVINAGAGITTDNNSGNQFYVQSGVFNLEGQTITPGTSGTLQVDANGTFCLGGTTSSTTATCDSGATQTSASTFPAFTTITLNSSSTVIFLADAAQTVTNTPTFGNLKFAPVITSARIYTLGGAMTINGNWDIIPSAGSALALTVNAAGDMTVAAGKTTTISKASSATSSLVLRPVSTDYNLSTGLLNVATGGTLDATSAASTITLTGTSGTILTLAGTFNVGTTTVIFNGDADLTTATSGAISVYNLQLTPTITANRAYTFGSTVTASNNFDINPTASSTTKTLTVNLGGTLTVTGTTTITGTTTGASVLDVRPSSTDYNVTTGLLNITNTGGGGTLDGTSAASTITLNGTSGTIFTLTGTFTAGSTTVKFTGNATLTITSGTFTGTNKFYNLQLTPAFVASGRTYTFGAGAIEVGNNFDIQPSSALQLLTVNMGAAITVTGTTTITRTAPATSKLDTTVSNYALTTGLLNVAAGGTFTSNSSLVTLTGTSGTLFTKGGTLTAVGATSEWDVTSASGTPTLLSAATTLHILKINAPSATVINLGADFTTDNNASNNLWVNSGVLNAEGRTITPGTSGTLQIDSGATLCVGGTTSATNATCDSGATQTTGFTFPAFTTYTFNAASTVRYLADAAQTVDGTPTYGNLYLVPVLTAGRIYTFEASTTPTINGDFTINPTAGSALGLTVNMGGNMTVAAGKTTTITRTTSATSSLVLRPVATDYTLSTGLINIATGGTLDATSTTSATLITITGTSGTLWTQTGTFTITSATSTVIFNGDGAPTLTSGTITFYNLTLSPSLGAARTYTFGSGALAINGDFTINPSAGGSRMLTVNMGAAITVASGKTTTIQGTNQARSNLDTISGSNWGLTTGALTIASGGQLTGQAAIITLTGTGTPFTMSDTYSYGTSTIAYTGNGATNVTALSGTAGSNGYYNLSVKPGGTQTHNMGTGASQTIIVNHDFTVGDGSNAGTADLSANNPTFTVTGDVLVNASGTLKASSSGTFNVTGNWTNNGTFTANSGTVTFNSTSAGKTIAGTLGSTSSFANLTFNGSGGGWSNSAAMTATGALTMTAGTLSGTNNVTVNGNAIGTAGIITLTGGTFEQRVGANRSFGTSSDSVVWTFYDLVFSNSSGALGSTITTQSPTTPGGISVTNTMTIGRGTDTQATSLNAGNQTWTLSGATGTPLTITASPAATLSAGTSTFSYTGNNGGGNTTVAAATYYNLILNNGAETFASGGTVAAGNDATVTAGIFDIGANTLGTITGNLTVNGTLQGTGNVTVVKDIVGTGLITMTGGTVTQQVSGNQNFGTSSGTNDWTFSSLTFTYNSGASNWTITTQSGSGGITVSSVLTLGPAVCSHQTILAASNRTWTLSGTGTPMVNNGCGELTPNTSTFLYTGNGATTIAKADTAGNDSYNNLWVQPGGNTVTHTLAAGVFTISGNFVAGDGTHTADTVTAATNSTTVNVTGNVTISANTTFVANGSNTMAVKGNWTNSGTFTHSSGTVQLNGTAQQTLNATMTGSSAFNNLTISNATGADDPGCGTSFTPGVIFADSATISGTYTITTASVRVRYTAAKTYTITNINFNGVATGSRIFFRSSSNGATWAFNVSQAIGAQVVSYVNVKDSNASGGTEILAEDGTNVDCTNNTNWRFANTLTFSLDSTSIDYGTITAGSTPSDLTSTLTTTTNSSSGYIVYAWSSQTMQFTKNSTTYTIDDWTGTNATPTTWNAGSYGFGYTTNDASLWNGSIYDNRFSTGTKFAKFKHSGPSGDITDSDPVADATAAITGDVKTVSYRLYPSTIQTAGGPYTTTIIYVAAAKFP